MKLKQILLILFLLPFIADVKAQSVEYGVSLDTNYMLIGDQQHLTLKVKATPDIRVVFPQLNDSLVPGIEIISGPIRDSIKGKDGSWLYEGKYLITAFDSGVYTIPALPITIEGKEYNNILRTDPVSLIVNTFQVDPQKGNYDIVMPYAAPWTFAEALPYISWVLLGLIIVALIVWYILRRRKNKPLFVARQEEIPPYVKAIRSLDEIKADRMWQAGKEKEYYTRLTDTVRQYLDEELGIPAMEQTSQETLKSLASCRKVGDPEREKMAKMLETADFVKFAKFTPLQDENARYLETAYEFVNHTHEKVQEEKAALEEKERKEKEETEKKVVAEMKEPEEPAKEDNVEK